MTGVPPPPLPGEPPVRATTGGTPPPPPPPPHGGTPPPPPSPPHGGTSAPPPPPSLGGTPPPPPPPAPFAPAPATTPGRNGFAVASMVLGIISVPMCFVFIPSVLAVVFGIIALSQISSNPGQAGRGQAITGLVLGGVSLALIVLLLALGPALDVETSMLVAV